jgi:hypothetical protein
MYRKNQYDDVDKSGEIFFSYLKEGKWRVPVVEDRAEL